MTHRILSTALALAVLAGPALAGGLTDPAPTPQPAPPPPPPVQVSTSDWSGFYAGGSVGQAEILNEGFDGTGFGIHGGYLADLGTIVVGGELEYGTVDVESNQTASDALETNVLRLKGRVGYDAGSFLPYVTAGIAQIDIPDEGIDTSGAMYGIGVDFRVTENVIVGAEYIRHDFDDEDLEVDSVGLRASFKF